MKYKIMVDDNFHYMDEDERYTHGEYETAEEALREAMQMVEKDLREFFTPGMTAKELYDHYTSFGVDPFIMSDDPDCKFSAWTYAKQRCVEICGPDCQE